MILIKDMTCNRCKGTYKNSDRKVMSVVMDSCYFSICPTCTKEVAALMGFTPETILKELARIQEADTENNRKMYAREGVVCAKCEVRFKEGEPRVRKSTSSNVRSWHLGCYHGFNEDETCEACECKNT